MFSLFVVSVEQFSMFCVILSVHYFCYCLLIKFVRASQLRTVLIKSHRPPQCNSLNEFILCYTVTVVNLVRIFVCLSRRKLPLVCIFEIPTLLLYSRWLHLRNQLGVKQGTFENLQVTRCSVLERVPFYTFLLARFEIESSWVENDSNLFRSKSDWARVVRGDVAWRVSLALHGVSFSEFFFRFFAILLYSWIWYF